MSADFFRKHEIPLVLGILALAFVHGMVYIFLVPPWQHYDEPTHFEHAWIMANKGEFPVSGEIDWDFRADLVRSLISHDFYGEGLAVPDPENLQPLPAGLRYAQLDDPPLYYLLASIPLRIMKSADLANQLVAARHVSLGMFLATVAGAWALLRTLTRAGSPLRIAVPFSLATLPGFVDLMTAVNNDVGAVLFFTLFLWVSVRLICRGFSIPGLLLTVLAAAAAVLTKSTAYPAVLFAGLAVALSLARGRGKLIAWGLLAAALAAGVVAVTYSGEAAYWYRAATQTEPVRVAVPEAPLGSYAISLDPASGLTPPWLRMLSQPLPFDEVEALAGRRMVLGFWMWYRGDPGENPELMVRPPAVRMDIASDEDVIFLQPVVIGDAPRFFTVPVRVPEDVLRIWVFLHPQLRETAPDLRILVDGLVLAEGAFDINTVPEFDDSSGETGTWGGQPFDNLLRNPSAESAWVAFRPEVDNVLARVLPDNIRPSNLLFSMRDIEGAGWYYRATADHLLESFYGKFGWGHVPLVFGERVYTPLFWLTALGLTGAAIYPLQWKRRGALVEVLVYLVLTMGVVWAGAFARGAIFIFLSSVFIPSARYAYPAIVPTLLALTAGWLGWGYRARQWLKLPAWTVYIGFAAGNLMLAALALFSVYAFYR